MAVGVLFDLDQTLIDSSSAAPIRGGGRPWGPVFALVPDFVVYDGISGILAMLTERKIPVCVVTSSVRSYCDKVIDHHKFGIVHRICYHDTSRRKPHPDPILAGIKKLGLPAREVWAIGDDPKDIQAAHAAGVHSVAVTWGSADPSALRAASAESIFDTVVELYAFLDELTSPPE
jgi:phosphoglycolate phosphatase-like HAD superfamily hydrolase